MGVTGNAVDTTIVEENVGRNRVHYDHGGVDEDFKGFLTHPVKIDHAALTSASASTLLTNDLTTFYVAAISATPLGKKIANFAYFRAKIKIRLVVQGQPFAAGKIVYAFTPLPQYGQGNADNVSVSRVVTSGNIVNAQIVPHICVDVGQSATYELELPIVTATGMYSLKGNTMGSYRAERIVINPLISGTATVPAVNICMYMSLEDVDFEGITLTSEVTYEYLNEIGGFSRGTANRKFYFDERLTSAFSNEKKPGGTLSTMAKDVSYVAGKSASIVSEKFPLIGPAVSLFSTVTSTIGDVLHFFGFSKPPNVENNHVILNRYNDNFSQFDGKSTAIVLAGSAKTSIGISPGFAAGDGNEMLLSHLASIPGLMRTFLVSQATAAETMLTTLPVSPAYGYRAGGIDYPTPIGGISVPFTYWVGDLDFTIEIIATVFHRATLLVAWDPVYNTTASAFGDVLQTLETVTIPVSGYSRTTITVPWKQVVNYKWVGFGDASGASSASYTNGVLKFYLVNPITANGSTDGIYVNVYSSSKNFRLFEPQSSNINGFWYRDEVLTSSVTYESIQQDPHVSLGKGIDLSLSVYRAFGEDYHSIKQLTSKMVPCLIATKTVDGAVTETYQGVAYPNYPYSLSYNNRATLVGGTYFNTFSSWYALAFLGYRGGMRYSHHAVDTNAGNDALKHHMFGGNVVSDITVQPLTVTYSSLTGPALLGTTFAFNGGNREIAPFFDGVTPAQHIYDFINTRCTIDKWRNWYLGLSAVAKPDTVVHTSSIQTTLLQGTADDGTFNFFLGFPGFTFA